MATILIHLTVAVIFVSFKISALKREIAAEIFLTIDEELIDPDLEKALELAKSEQFQGATIDEMVNIIKNIAERPLDIDPAEYEEMVKEEMIKSGQLSEKNFIDERKIAEEDHEDEISIPGEEIIPVVAEKKVRPEERGTFSGPTRIYYDLKDRHHRFLPIPIYKCEGAGQITLAIVVDRSGRVLKAEPASKLSTTKDRCLTDTAIEYALKTLFNQDITAPERQAGFLTFVFVAQ